MNYRFESIAAMEFQVTNERLEKIDPTLSPTDCDEIRGIMHELCTDHIMDFIDSMVIRAIKYRDFIGEV